MGLINVVQTVCYRHLGPGAGFVCGRFLRYKETGLLILKMFLMDSTVPHCKTFTLLK